MSRGCRPARPAAIRDVPGPTLKFDDYFVGVMAEKTSAENRRARQLLERLEAWVALIGGEVKSLRAGRTVMGQAWRRTGVLHDAEHAGGDAGGQLSLPFLGKRPAT